ILFTDTPKEIPSLTVDKFRYSSGEQIQANCTSRASFPAANLTWFVNDQQVGQHVSFNTTHFIITCISLI
ncbi:hypothetical protein C0J52_14474, partial [Blattella germanica]